ncbi:unnamed protein product [Arabidopsis arenosa]|uniref:Uncharacterized protein n=1 Tax=Arabidopsis arenosa TaxID=38785 RepID=A0A8S2B5H6_ARAAE|nr:unnamed protein product [Arabidopsis arenosa]
MLVEVQLDVGARDRGRGRGRSRGALVADESVAQSATVEQDGGLHADREGSEGLAGGGAGVAGVPAEAVERVPAQAPGVPPVAEMQPRVAVAEELPSYIKMMEQMQRIGTEFFSVVELVETAVLLEEGLKDEVVVTSPTLQPKKPQQQFSSSKSGKPVQGYKRKKDETHRASQGG